MSSLAEPLQIGSSERLAAIDFSDDVEMITWMEVKAETGFLEMRATTSYGASTYWIGYSVARE